MKLTIVEKLVDSLADLDIDTYFLVTGGAIAPFVDAVGRSTRAKYYCFHHEQAASMAAEGYYRACGKIGVVMTTSGPGAQNIINGLCGCWFDSIPVLFITGQVNSKESLDSIKSKPRQIGFQEMPVVSMVSSCTKFSTKIESTQTVFDQFSKVLSAMVSDRPGPGLIDFPVNLQMESSPEASLIISKVIPPPVIVSDSVHELIRAAERPLLVLGAGARPINPEWLTVPFVTTWAAFDIVLHDHPMRVGCHGVYGDRVANYAVQNADLLIILGSRLDARQVGGNNSLFSRESKRIMVDIDPEEIEKCNERGLRIDIGLVGPVSSFVERVSLDARPIWLNTLATWKNEFGTEITREGNVYKYIESIQLPDECIVIPDQGGNLIWTMQSLKLKGKQRLFTNLGNSSMGWAIAASIGAAIATDKKVPIVCIEGDGGIQMNIQELATIKALNLPITIIVLNNTGYGIMKQFQDSYFSSRYTATSASDVFGDAAGLDFVKIAEAYGIEAKRTDVTPISSDKPILFDVPIISTQKIFPKLEFGNSLENMTPFRNELHKFMIIPPVQPNIPMGWRKD